MHHPLLLVVTSGHSVQLDFYLFFKYFQFFYHIFTPQMPACKSPLRCFLIFFVLGLGPAAGGQGLAESSWQNELFCSCYIWPHLSCRHLACNSAQKNFSQPETVWKNTDKGKKKRPKYICLSAWKEEFERISKNGAMEKISFSHQCWCRHPIFANADANVTCRHFHRSSSLGGDEWTARKFIMTQAAS